MRSNYKWYVLTLALFSFGWISGTDRNCMPVLFDEISKNLNLSLVSIGTIWGMDPLAGVFVGLLGGLLVDRFGIRKTLTVICLLAGLFCAIRGLSVDFLTMAGSMFLFGIVVAMLPSVVPKAAAVWFPARQVGVVNALINIALSIGSMFATMLSASVLSPWLGGWRNVLFVLAVPAVLAGVLWATTYRDPRLNEMQSTVTSSYSLKDSLTKVLKMKQVWIISLIALSLWGSIMGLMGYLPMYLRSTGMAPALADTAVTVINAAGMIGSIPMVLLANRLRAYKPLLFISMLVNTLSLILIPFVKDSFWIWPVLFISSFMRSSTPALTNVMLLETRGVGVIYIGTAMGLMSSMGMVGGFIASPLGNAMTRFGSEWAFFSWAILSAVTLPLFLFMKRPPGEEDPSEFEERIT